MLSRHFLRAKALQSVYAYRTSDNKNIVNGENLFALNINRLNDLGILQLSTLTEMVRLAEQILEDGQRKFMPTEEEKNPSRRFVDNMFIARLGANYEMQKYQERMKIDWSLQSDAFRKLYARFRETELFKEYMAAEPSYEGDRKLAMDLFRCIVNDETIVDAFASRELLWDDDFDQVAQYNFMMMKALDEETFDEGTHIPLMHDERNEKDREDYDFALQLFLNTVKHIDENEPLIGKHLQNWELERVALMDILLINMAITEFTTCPSIPERVTVDEYIELSKEFSTEKSKLFINGILDKILIELKVAGRVNKSGRGLYDPELLKELEKNNEL